MFTCHTCSESFVGKSPGHSYKYCSSKCYHKSHSLEIGTEKQCTKCRHLLPVSSFVARPTRPSGYTSSCKECIAAYKKGYRARSVEKMQAYRKRYYAENKELIKERRVPGYHRDYYARNKDKALSKYREYKRLNPEKVRARGILNNAVASGKVSRPNSCAKCRKRGRIEAHHEDYSKPLDVAWLCLACHISIERLKKTT